MHIVEIKCQIRHHDNKQLRANKLIDFKITVNHSKYHLGQENWIRAKKCSGCAVANMELLRANSNRKNKCIDKQAQFKFYAARILIKYVIECEICSIYTLLNSDCIIAFYRPTKRSVCGWRKHCGWQKCKCSSRHCESLRD